MNLAPEKAAAIKAYFATVPLNQYLGLEIDSLEDGRARIRLVAGKNLANGKGQLHGAVFAALVDAAGAIAVRTVVNFQYGLSTIEMKINYLEPAHLGKVYGEGRVLRAGSSVAVTEVDIKDAEGKLLAKALASYKILRR